MNRVDEDGLVDVERVSNIEGPWQAGHFLLHQRIDRLELGLVLDVLTGLPIKLRREVVDARRRDEGNRLQEGVEVAAALFDHIVGDLPHVDQAGCDGLCTGRITAAGKR